MRALARRIAEPGYVCGKSQTGHLRRILYQSRQSGRRVLRRTRPYVRTGSQGHWATTCARSRCPNRSSGSRTRHQPQLRRWRRRRHGFPARQALKNLTLRHAEIRPARSDYGQHNGLTKLLTWQIGTSSSKSDHIFAPQLLDQTLSGGHPTPFGEHHKWDKLFVRIKPPDNHRVNGPPSRARRTVAETHS
jgi:hypothetical protein